MDSGRKVRLFFVLAIWNAVMCVILYLSHPALQPSQDWRTTQLQKRNVLRWRKSFHHNNKQERKNIFFLKTHKCGSSTVQNILMRFGYTRHLDFVLPHAGNYLGYGTDRFHPKCVAKETWSPNQTFNIFAHHTRYHFDRIKSIMEEDAAFVTIFRDPSYVFEAVYYFYDFARPMKMGLKELIRSPKDWLKVKQKSTRKIYGTNQISWDLGFDTNTNETRTSAKNDTKTVKEFIRKTDREFDLVMILEHMEASLVLLCNLMNWPLEHVVHLQLNKRSADRVTQLDPGERHTILKMNSIDERVYKYFLKKFWRLVRDYGVEKMKSQVEKLLNLNSDLKRNCMLTLNYDGFRKTVSYDARNREDTLCYYATLNELEFTEKIREDQFRRFSVLRELDALTTENAATLEGAQPQEKHMFSANRLEIRDTER